MARGICRVECGQCGMRDITVADITVRHCLTNHLWEYRYWCPSCRTIQLREIRSPITILNALHLVAALLRAAGDPRRMASPRGLDKVSGPPLTLMDLADLVEALDEEPSAQRDA